MKLHDGLGIRMGRVRSSWHAADFRIGDFNAGQLLRQVVAIGVFSLLGAGTGYSRKTGQDVRLMDYFYPARLGATWRYLSPKEDGGYKATVVEVNNPSLKLNLADSYKRVLWMSTVSGRYANGKFNFNNSIVLSNDYYGLKSNYAIYGVEDPSSNTYLRFSPGAVFPEKIRLKQPVSVRTGIFDLDGRRGPDVTVSIELLGKETVTVPAGTFADCIHLRFSISFKGGPSRNAEEWWAKGIGAVKTRTPKAQGKASISELHSYDIPYELALKFERAGADFGFTSIGSGVTRRFRVKNHGKTTIPDLTCSISGSDSFTCKRVGSGNLAPGETAQFDVTFTPKGFSPYRGVLTVQGSDNPANVCEQPLRGIGSF